MTRRTSSRQAQPSTPGSIAIIGVVITLNVLTAEIYRNGSDLSFAWRAR